MDRERRLRVLARAVKKVREPKPVVGDQPVTDQSNVSPTAVYGGM